MLCEMAAAASRIEGALTGRVASGGLVTTESEPMAGFVIKADTSAVTHELPSESIGSAEMNAVPLLQSDVSHMKFHTALPVVVCIA